MTETAPEATPDATPQDPYDPSAHNMDDVLEYLAAHPDQVETVLAAEQDGKARKGVLSYTVEDAQAEADQAAADLAQPEPWSPEGAGLDDDGYTREVIYPER